MAGDDGVISSHPYPGKAVLIILSKASRKCTSTNADFHAFLTGASLIKSVKKQTFISYIPKNEDPIK
ncbi:hypothetical protein I2483_05280 [Sporosarcina sp. E16_3]|uniref:hypothetical protein n=1 Tax=Sporosarcina sp. E16_3 TaxID=2789293 RepID=UPI001A9277B3|nr:hypothetical protein [Sporosarcina sp. E16_3]MBO0601065.1 hypothetical protein [Sporosarcina sp. E16_3]